MSRIRTAVWRAVERLEATHLLHLAGLQTPTCRANPILGATVNVIGTLAVFEAARALQGPGASGSSTPARRRSTGRPSPDAGGPLGDEVRLAPLTPLRRVQGLQRAERPGLLARPRDHQHRPAALDGLRRRSRLRHDQRADQGHQVGRRRPAVPDQLRRPAGPAVRRRRRRDVPPGPDAPVRRGRRVQPPRGRRADRDVRAALCDVVPEPRELVTHGDRQLPIAPDLDDTRLEARLGPIPRTPLRDGIAETYRAVLRPREGRDGSTLAISRMAPRAKSRLSGSGRRSPPCGAATERRLPRAWRACVARGGAFAGAAWRRRGREPGNRSLGIGLTSILAVFRFGVHDPLLKLVGREHVLDERLVLLEVDRLAFLAVGDLDQVEAEGRLDRVGDRALLQREGDVGELLDEAAVEREVVEVAPGASELAGSSEYLLAAAAKVIVPPRSLS